MQLNKWLTGLAPCIILLFILSLSLVDVEGKKSRHKGGKHGPRHGSPSGGRPSHPHIGQDPGVRQVTQEGKGKERSPSVVAPNGPSCPNLSQLGDMENNFSELWREVQQLSNPIHIHVHGGNARAGYPHSPSHVDRYYPYSPGGKSHHRPRSAGGKEHRHPHKPGGKGGKEHRHSNSPGAGKAKQSPKAQKTGQTKESHHGRRSRHHGHNGNLPSHETHIHVHITLDTEENKFEKFIAKHFDDYEYARCDLIASEKDSPVTGTVLMRQMFNELVEVKVNISGMAGFRPSGLTADHISHHGLHVHQFADFTQGCTSFGGHYNPKNTTHGPENEEDSHAGDWGNIDCDIDGSCVATMNITNSVLLGPFSIIGRGIVLHKLEDDLGQVGDKGSLTTGNAGKRLACCGIVRIGPPSDDDW